VGTHGAPSWQAPHCPDRQTIPAPHDVPFGWSPFSVHTGAPVVQATAPVLHGCPVKEHEPPAVHAMQAPPLQTMPCPQAVPFAWGCCVSVQAATPLEQVVCPRWQRLVGVQPLPRVHGERSVPASVRWPPAPPAAEPPLPPVPAAPPVPDVLDPPSDKTGSSRRPQPKPEHPRSTVSTSSRRNILSPWLRSEAHSRTPEYRYPERKRTRQRRRHPPGFPGDPVTRARTIPRRSPRALRTQ
jgi:hypothetical protein